MCLFSILFQIISSACSAAAAVVGEGDCSAHDFWLFVHGWCLSLSVLRAARCCSLTAVYEMHHVVSVLGLYVVFMEKLNCE